MKTEKDQKSDARIVEIAKNLLGNKTCKECKYSNHCTFKSKKKYNTCLRWEKYEFDLAINSYSVKVQAQKLNVVWTKLDEMDLENKWGSTAEDELIESVRDEMNRKEKWKKDPQ